MADVNNLSYSKRGLALTEQFEGRRLEAYQDSVGVWTIGYGHTGPDVHAGLSITQEQAGALLLQDVGTAVATVNRLVTVPLTQNQFDALVDFVFNLGSGNFARSTLLRELNAGNTAAAAAQFLVWNRAGGVVLPGLTRRRQAEAELFETAETSAKSA
jgi:lysozyme